MGGTEAQELVLLLSKYFSFKLNAHFDNSDIKILY